MVHLTNEVSTTTNHKGGSSNTRGSGALTEPKAPQCSPDKSNKQTWQVGGGPAIKSFDKGLQDDLNWFISQTEEEKQLIQEHLAQQIAKANEISRIVDSLEAQADQKQQEQPQSQGQPQDSRLSTTDVSSWIEDKVDCWWAKKDKDCIVNLIEKTNIRRHASSLATLTTMFRANVSIIRANVRLCHRAMRHFEDSQIERDIWEDQERQQMEEKKKKEDQQKKEEVSPQPRISRFKPSLHNPEQRARYQKIKKSIINYKKRQKQFLTVNCQKEARVKSPRKPPVPKWKGRRCKLKIEQSPKELETQARKLDSCLSSKLKHFRERYSLLNPTVGRDSEQESYFDQSAIKLNVSFAEELLSSDKFEPCYNMFQDDNPIAAGSTILEDDEEDLVTGEFAIQLENSMINEEEEEEATDGPQSSSGFGSSSLSLLKSEQKSEQASELIKDNADIQQLLLLCNSGIQQVLNGTLQFEQLHSFKNDKSAVDESPKQVAQDDSPQSIGGIFHKNDSSGPTNKDCRVSILKQPFEYAVQSSNSLPKSSNSPPQSSNSPLQSSNSPPQSSQCFQEQQSAARKCWQLPQQSDDTYKDNYLYHQPFRIDCGRDSSDLDAKRSLNYCDALFESTERCREKGGRDHPNHQVLKKVAPLHNEVRYLRKIVEAQQSQLDFLNLMVRNLLDQAGDYFQETRLFTESEKRRCFQSPGPDCQPPSEIYQEMPQQNEETSTRSETSQQFQQQEQEYPQLQSELMRSNWVLGD